MEIYNGVHGTTEQAAIEICKNGFKIPSKEDFKLSYGNGIYFFENSIYGKFCACQWAKKKTFHHNISALIEVKIFYNLSESYNHDKNKFIEYFDTFLRPKYNMKFSMLNNIEKNELLFRYINKLEQKYNRNFKIIFTSFIINFSNIHYNMPGCVVRDINLLPKPLKYEVCNNG